MSRHIFSLRRILETLSLPAFAILVVHMSGHGVRQIIESGHVHNEAASSVFHQIFSAENLIGVVALGLFTWLWHRPVLKRWVPCHHDHCHGEIKLSHIFATIALCLHFFPEAEIRHDILTENPENILYTLGAIAFGIHFFVDLFVAVIISSYWEKSWHQVASLIIIATVWSVAFFSAENFELHLPHSLEGLVSLFSGFLLAMFLHRPHPPQVCKSCG